MSRVSIPKPLSQDEHGKTGTGIEAMTTSSLSHSEDPFSPAILTVDDDPDIGIAITDFLNREGYAVQVVGTGQAALTAVRCHHFHAVILDLGLPDVDGLDVLKELAEWDPNLPIIILTAYSTFERQISKIDLLPAFAYLDKPFNRKELKGTISRAVRKRKLLNPDG